VLSSSPSSDDVKSLWMETNSIESDPEYTDQSTDIENNKVKGKRQKKTRATTMSSVKANTAILNALSTEPEHPPPPRQEMLKMLQEGRHIELVPYFKVEIGDTRDPLGVRRKIMKHLDPDAFTLVLKKQTRRKRQDFQPVPKKRRKSQESPKLENKEPPSMDEMIQMYRDGKYVKLEPFFKNEIKGVVSPTGVRWRIRNALKVKANDEQLKLLEEGKTESDSDPERKTKVDQAFAQEPLTPPHSRQEMLEIFREGRYLELVPYFKSEIGKVRSSSGIRLRIMKALDPKEYDKTLMKHKESSKRSEERSKKRIREAAQEDEETELEDEKSEEVDDGSQQESLSLDEMIKVFRAGRYKELIPFFKDEVKGAISPAGISRRILNALKVDANEEQLEALQKIQNGMDESHPAHKEILKSKSLQTKKREKILKALSQEPLDPPPSREEMLRLFRLGGYLELIPYFKNEVRGVQSLPGIRLRLMKALDPDAYAKTMEDHKLAQRTRAKKRRS
jgi:hypothetical protein